MPVRCRTATPTHVGQTPQSSPPGRRGIRIPCAQFSASSAFGSIATADNGGGSGGGGGGSSSVGSCFGAFRSRTPSPNLGALLTRQHRRGGSIASASGTLSAMSAISANDGTGNTSSSNPLDVSFDSSANTAEDASMMDRRHGSSPSQPRIPSPRHVPLMVLTKRASEDATDEPPSGRVLTQDFDREEKQDQKSQGDVEPKVEQFLFEASVPTPQLSTPSVPAATAGSPRASSSVASSSASSSAAGGGSFGRFGLSPRKPLPPRMINPTKLQESPMIKSPHVASSSAPTPPRPIRTIRPLLSPRRTAKDSKIADLLFGDDDPCPSNVHDHSPPTPSKSKPPPLPSAAGQNHDDADMGAVMDGLLMGFTSGRSLLKQKDHFESSNSLAFSMASSTTSSDKMKAHGADHSFPIKSFSFGGNEDERKMPAEADGADCSSRQSSSQATPVRNGSSGNIGFELLQGFKARSVLTPSKSGGSLQRLFEADRLMREKADREDLDNGSLSDSCDGSRGPKDMFFLNSPEAVTAESIQAAEVENSAGRYVHPILLPFPSASSCFSIYQIVLLIHLAHTSSTSLFACEQGP